MKNFISLNDVDSLLPLIHRSIEAKHSPKSIKKIGEGKTLGMVFFNPSLRTRLSTQIAAEKLGIKPIYLNVTQDIWNLELEDNIIMSGNKTEHIKDFCSILNAYFDIVSLRVFPQLLHKEDDEQEKILHTFLKHIQKPIISLESNQQHPLQSLADMVTIEQTKTVQKPKIVLTWAPHIKPIPHCVVNSFCSFAHSLSLDITITAPKGYEIQQKYAQNFPIEHEQEKALKDADFVYVKNWSSTNPYGKVLEQDFDWTFSKEKLALTNNAKVMHCMPIRRNVEITDEVLDSKNNITSIQAENRIWSCLTVLEKIIQHNYG